MGDLLTKALSVEVEIEKLVEHMAAPDKQVSFLFGAGTSAAVSGRGGKPLIPAVAELTDWCERAVRHANGNFGAAWDALAYRNGRKQTIEGILSSVRQLKAVLLPGDRAAGLDKYGLEHLELILRETILEAVEPELSDFPAALPHDSLSRWIAGVDRLQPVEIFTTNYDTIIERSLANHRVPVFDGFVGAYNPYFDAAGLRSASVAGHAADWTKLWKIHGSTSWGVVQDGEGRSQIVRHGNGQKGHGELILPSALKYDESRKQPYLAILDRLRDVLHRREDSVLVTSGYSFADDHINEVVFEALAANPRLHVFALLYGDVEEGALARTARTRPNLLVLGRRTGIVSRKDVTWRSELSKGHPRIDGLFRFNPESDTGDGHLLLGDFNALAKAMDRVTL